MSHAAEEWTDRYGREHTSCGECEESWPCRESSVKAAGWLVPGFLSAKDVISTVAHGFGVTVDDVLGAQPSATFKQRGPAPWPS